MDSGNTQEIDNQHKEHQEHEETPLDNTTVDEVR
jgi:hypothetical protein